MRYLQTGVRWAGRGGTALPPLPPCVPMAASGSTQLRWLSLCARVFRNTAGGVYSTSLTSIPFHPLPFLLSYSLGSRFPIHCPFLSHPPVLASAWEVRHWHHSIAFLPPMFTLRILVMGNTVDKQPVFPFNN